MTGMQWLSAHPREGHSATAKARLRASVTRYASRGPRCGDPDLGHEGNSRRGVGGDRFDDEAVLASTRVRRPPPVAFVVAAVVAREPRRIELRHRDCVLAQLEQRLQRAACVDFAVVVEREPNDLKHERDPRVGWLASAVHAVRCGSLTMLRGSRPAAITRPTRGALVRAPVSSNLHTARAI